MTLPMSYGQKLVCLASMVFICCSQGKKATIDLDYQPTTVEIFGEGYISTPLFERDMTIAPDGNELIYTLGNHKQTLRNLVSVKRRSSGWGEKQLLPFSGRYNDIEPFLAVDGQQLFFASNRPTDSDTTRTDYNIWVVDRKGSGWGSPVPLDTLINSKGDEFYPAVSRNKNLYFTATRPNSPGREDIFLSAYTNGNYQSPVPLDSTINTSFFEFNAFINPEEDLLVFSSFGREDGKGGGDLYYSIKNTEGKWAKAKNMGAAVNSKFLEYCPFIDTPRGNFYFTSEKISAPQQVHSVSELESLANQTLNGTGNIYRIALSELKLN